MRAGLTSCSLSLHEDRVLARWCGQCQLIEGQHLTASLCDTLACTIGDTKCAETKLWNVEETDIVGDGSNNDSDLVVLCFAVLQDATDALQRDDGLVDAAHEQATQDDLVELLVSSAVKEAIQLKQPKRDETLGLKVMLENKIKSTFSCILCSLLHMIDMTD